LLENHRTGHDDALVVVARMAGGDS
jgi:hypothetical protein